MRDLPMPVVVLRATFVALVLLSGLAFSTRAGAVPLPPPTPPGSPLPGSTFQGADGDQVPAPPLIDWATLLDRDPPQVAHSPDPPEPNTPDDKFKPGSKELEPIDWDFVTGSTPDKANILDAWSSVDQAPQLDAATITFLYLAFAREAGASSAAFLTFELNRDDRLWRNPAGALIPCRRDGDLLITFVPEGNALRLYVRTWEGSVPAGALGCAGRGTLSDPANVTPNVDVQGAFNVDGPISNPLGGPGAAPLGQYRFGETAINLGKILSLALDETCGAFTSFWMHSRASPTVESNMEDFVAPHEINARKCSASGTKYLDSNANGERDAGEPGLAGWRIYADLNGDGRFDDGEPFDITDVHGHYTIDDIKATGTYTLREERTSVVPAAPWTCSDPSPCEHVVDAAAEPNPQGLNFGNWRPALLTLTKEVRPPGDPGHFTLTAGSPETTVTLPTPDAGTSKTFEVMPGISYTVSETAAAGTNPADYDSAVECAPVTRLGRLLRGASASTGVIFAGQHVECTFVNTRRGSPSVTLRKIFIGPLPAVHGDTLRFRLAVTNTSSGSHAFAADDVHVTDSRCTPRVIRKLDGTGAEDPTPGSLDPLDTWIYACRVTTHHVDPDTCEPTTIHNTGHVTVAPGVEDEDSTEVELDCPVPPRPGVSIQKIGPETALAGTALTYVFYVRNTGEVPFAEAHVTVSDPACDAAPALVGRFNAAGDPDTSSPAVLSPGDVWVYTCTNSTPAPGASCQPSVVTNTGTVVATSNGHAARDSDDFETPLTCAPPEPPAPQPQPEPPAPTPGEGPSAVVPPAAGVAGDAALSPIRGCLRRGSRVVVNGTRIASITVTVRGRRVGGLRVTTFQRRAVIRIVRNLTPGRHRATAIVRFHRGAATPTLRITRTVSICARAAAVRPPRFTG